jgi:nicotinamidase/pyrazinamidase
LPGGALPVPHGDEVIPLANELQQRFEVVLATQDWHSPEHGSFATNHPGKKPGDRIMLDGIEQILWPVHCVQHTHGAEFATSFDTSQVAQVFHKGIDQRIDSYSTFFDNAHRRSTGLAEYLNI